MLTPVVPMISFAEPPSVSVGTSADMFGNASEGHILFFVILSFTCFWAQFLALCQWTCHSEPSHQCLGETEPESPR
jgi:F0F1-type ATP synthase membrane subunit a